ncbi:probable transcription regulator protein [Roseobacter sp. SK209-2-6]|uniref:LysR family transcriptional regulator n=1 Tax=Roseobacter sp. SK209-2-6 TaxID=388739 RepID=UPI0000F3F457|nr:LysR family transcriptional regulator [Roseobacter sp. SK209-2-6]EBA16410.1 probable transcription regulator protein [Roseobacter sp. SK209-2-6]
MGQKTELEILLAVVDHGNFSAAARALGYTPSAVGKRVHQLEQRLKVPLLVRSTRRMTLTGAGRRYVEEARELFVRLTALEDDITDDADTLRGTIRLTSSAALGRLHVVPLVIEFMERHPDIEIELILTDKIIDLISDGFDLAIRSGILPDSSLVSRRLMSNRRRPFAAPAYLEQHGVPEKPEDLVTHKCLRLGQERQVSDWGFNGRQGGNVRLGPGFLCNSLEALHAACCAERGIAWLPEFLVSNGVHEGRLVPLLEDYTESDAGGGVFILRPETAFLPRRVRTMVDFLADRFSEIDTD